MTLDDLDYPFYCVSSAEQLNEIDTSFAYHVLISDKKVRALCSDIPCVSCPFTCKQAENRQETLIAFARQEFPEMCI